MKALTGLPTTAYLKASEEANIPLADLLKLVQHLEAGTSPAYLARYRPDVSANLDEEQIQALEVRLRGFLDLEDRRVTILTAISQQNQLTPELRSRVESVMDRRELEDLYLPFKPKRLTAADEAMEKGLEPLARFLWDQQPDDANIEAVAREHLSEGVSGEREALRGARAIVARWLGEDAELRKELRDVVQAESDLVVAGDDAAKNRHGQEKWASLIGNRARSNKVSWRQLLTVRRGMREGQLSYRIALPENRIVEHLLHRVIGNRRTLFCSHLGAAACEAYQQYLRPAFESEVNQAVNDRCDAEALRVFQKNLGKVLMTPPAGPMATIGLETARAGGWRAAVVGAEGDFLEGVVIDEREGKPAEETASSEAPRELTNQPAANEETEKVAQPETTAEQAEPESGESQDGALSPAEAGEATPAMETAIQAGDGPAPIAAASENEKTSSSDRLPTAEEEPSATGEAGDKAAPPGQESALEGAVPGRPQQPPEAVVAAESRRPSENAPRRASLGDLITQFNVRAIAIGNGPGVRQIERFIRSALRQAGAPKVAWTTVHDAGSWIYATSKTARRELPNLDPAIRSAATLARRLQDPLSEFVKLDPKVLGVGQSHQDVDPRRLRAGLRNTLAVCVHRAGVDLNNAPLDLLALVPALTERVAKRIVEHRRQNGRFARRQQLREVSGISDRMYEQAVGFCRVYGGENPLDGTGIHPRTYPMVEKMLSSLGVSAGEALENPERLNSLQLEEFSSEEYPIELLRAIVREFQPAVRNPRGRLNLSEPAVDLKPAGELKAGMKVEGVITNIAKFGAFVDIGAEQDGLVHVSQLSDKFVEDPQSAVKVGDRVAVHILSLEEDGKRISLSMKDPAAQRPRAPARGRPPGEERRGNGMRRRREAAPGREGGFGKRTFGPDEKAKARETKDQQKLSLDQKLALLENKFRTKI